MASGIFDSAFNLGPISISPHFFLESLAYFAGFALYRRERQRTGDFLASPDRTSLVVAAIIGAAVGSKLLAWLEDPVLAMRHWSDWAFLLGGKTIVGGLFGGTMAVEFTKARLGIGRRTGDLFALPIVAGTAIGRIGCFLAGLRDRTYGNPTAYPGGSILATAFRAIPPRSTRSFFCSRLALSWCGCELRPTAKATFFASF
jgi:prolipoprotein diacylglyceryltransferase